MLNAAAIGVDAVEIRRRNLFANDGYPVTSPANTRFEGLSHHAPMEMTFGMMDYEALFGMPARFRRASVVGACESRIEKLESEKLDLNERDAKSAPPKGRPEDCIELSLNFPSRP